MVRKEKDKSRNRVPNLIHQKINFKTKISSSQLIFLLRPQAGDGGDEVGDGVHPHVPDRRVLGDQVQRRAVGVLETK